MNRIFYKTTPLNTWEHINFEDIKKGDKIKMLELSPDQTEVLVELQDIQGDYNIKKQTCEFYQMGNDYYLPINQEMREAFDQYGR